MNFHEVSIAVAKPKEKLLSIMKELKIVACAGEASLKNSDKKHIQEVELIPKWLKVSF